MKVKGHELDVNYAEELEPYMNELKKVRIRGEKLQACSPFREEEHPSFAVNLDNGTWIDSGSYEEDWRKGNFVKLLAFFMGLPYEETENYLLEKYRAILSDTDNLALDIQLERDEKYRVVTDEELKEYAYANKYLGNRGITEKVQRAFKIGYDRKSNAVVFVWFDKDGNPINLKFRKVSNKIFWYLSDGQPIKKHVYGLHFFYKMNLSTAYVVESETDALYLWSFGVPAIALGSASLSKEQERLILNSPIDTLVMAFDKDDAGNNARENVIERLLGKVNLYHMSIPKGCKDVNDISKGKMEEAVQRVEQVKLSFL